MKKVSILDSHIDFIEKRYKRDVDYLSANVGWVQTGTSITSKIYETREYVATYWVDGVFVHEATSM